MKILIINGSPYKENSTTLKITRAFMEGLNETAEIVHTIDLDINPCRACYACWVKTNGDNPAKLSTALTNLSTMPNVLTETANML